MKGAARRARLRWRATWGGALSLLLAVAGEGRASSAPPMHRDRLALVIGVSDYRSGRLPNAKNDAELTTANLEQAGFLVAKRIDVTKDQMERELSRFDELLRENQAEVALFYFAGHGVQVEDRHYLVPSGASQAHADAVDQHAVALDRIIDTIASAGVKIVIVIIDTCRIRQLAKPSTLGVLDVASRDLLGVQMFVAFSTSPGAQTFDGEGEHSPYTREFNRLMLKKDKTIEDVFRGAGERVRRDHRGRITPWQHSSLTEPFYFRPQPDASGSARGVRTIAGVGTGAAALGLGMLAAGIAVYRASGERLAAERGELELSPDRQSNIAGLRTGQGLIGAGVGLLCVGAGLLTVGLVRRGKLRAAKPLTLAPSLGARGAGIGVRGAF